MKNAFFIVGGPGSGKDILIKYIREDKNIQEYTTEQILKFKSFCGNFIVKGNAYDLDNILESKLKLEENNYNVSLLFVDVSDNISKQRVGNRNMFEESRKTKFEKSKENLDIFSEIFQTSCIFHNNKDIKDLQENIQEIDLFLESVLNPISFIKEKSLRNAKDYVYSNFMKDKETKKDSKLKSFHADGPITPSGMNQYDIRTAGQSNVIHYTNEDIGSPENLSSLTGMSINPPDDMPRLDKFTIKPEFKKPKMYKRFNSPSVEELKKSNLWKKSKEIVFGKEDKEDISDKFKRYLK
jgi:hypothetical protein